MADDRRIEKAARAAHEVNRVYSREVMDDDSHLPWHNAPEWVRDSVFEGVRHIARQPDLTAAEIHGLWMDRKLSEGWVYGDRRDERAKTHPCLVPFHQLPVTEKVKDALFGAVVRAVLDIDPYDENNIKTDPGKPRRGQIGQ